MLICFLEKATELVRSIFCLPNATTRQHTPAHVVYHSLSPPTSSIRPWIHLPIADSLPPVLSSLLLFPSIDRRSRHFRGVSVFFSGKPRTRFACFTNVLPSSFFPFTAWTAASVFAGHDSKIVFRSAEILGYPKNLQYKEVMGFKVS